MADLRIAATEQATLSKGSFGEKREGQSLLIPQPLVSNLGSLRISTALQLLSYALSFPTILAAALSWSLEDVNRAGRRLARTLELTDDELAEFGGSMGVAVDDNLIGRTAAELRGEAKEGDPESSSS